jgi:hypothetical protein
MAIASHFEKQERPANSSPASIEEKVFPFKRNTEKTAEKNRGKKCKEPLWLIAAPGRTGVKFMTSTIW